MTDTIRRIIVTQTFYTIAWLLTLKHHNRHVFKHEFWWNKEWPSRNLIRTNSRFDSTDVSPNSNNNIAIIKIGSDNISSHVSINHQTSPSSGIKPHHHVAGISANKLIIYNNSDLHLSEQQQNFNINHNLSIDGHKRNARSHRYWCIAEWDTHCRIVDSFLQILA